MKYVYRLLLLGVFLLQSCAVFNQVDESEYGRLVVKADVLVAGGSAGPWWDYQLWVKHQESGDIDIIRISVERSMKLITSLPLAPGMYDIVRWDYDADRTVKTPPRPKFSGEFEILPMTATVFDKSLTITLTPSEQNFEFSQQTEAFTQAQYDALTDGNQYLESMPFYWSITKDLTWKSKTSLF